VDGLLLALDAPSFLVVPGQPAVEILTVDSQYLVASCPSLLCGFVYLGYRRKLLMLVVAALSWNRIVRLPEEGEKPVPSISIYAPHFGAGWEVVGHLPHGDLESRGRRQVWNVRGELEGGHR